MNEKWFQIHKTRLQDLLFYAKASIPYYKSLKFDSVYYTSSYNKWMEIPIVRKAMIQQNFESFISKNIDPKHVLVTSTSGSSGLPLKILKDRNEEIGVTKRLWNRRKIYNQNIMAMKLLFMYRNIESKHLDYLRVGTDEYLDLSVNALEKYHDQILNYKPEWLIGPPTAVTRLANFFRNKQTFLNSLKLVELTGELLLPYQRKLIEEVFNCKIANLYGTREFGVMSYECPYNKLHAFSENLFFEVIKNGMPAGEGEEGELVVTLVGNKSMPFIRYAVGDIVRIYDSEKCACHNKSFILEPLGGRVANFVYTRDKIFTSVVFDTVFSNLILKYSRSIKEFQIIQREIDKFEVYIVPDKNYTMLIEELIKMELIKYAPKGKFRFHIVPEIQIQSSGKMPSFIQKINEKEGQHF